MSSAPSSPAPLGNGIKRRRDEQRMTGPRKRTVVACDVCRQQKEKCEGGPPCRRCTRLRKNCRFHGMPMDRSRSGVSSTIREASSQLNAENTRDSRVQDLEYIARDFLGLPDSAHLDDFEIRQAVEKIADPVGSGGHDGHQGLQTSGPNVEEESFDTRFVSKVTAHYSGEFSHWNFSQKLWRRVSQRLERSGGNNLGQRIQVKDYWRPTQLQSPVNIVLQTMEHLPPYHVAQFLVKLFFKHVQLNYFFIEEDWISAKLQHSYSESPEFSASDVSWVCSLFAVLAIGTQVAHIESESATMAEEGEDLTMCSEDDVGKLFFHSAHSLVPDVIALASQESVQACLLLATYAMPLSTGGLSYTYLGLAMDMIILNGMHRKYTGSGCDARTIETRNRLFWTAYSLQTYIGVMHGRPVSITKSDINVERPVNFPGLRSPNFGNLIAFIEFNDCLAESANALKQFKKCPRSLALEYAARLLQVRDRIKRWWDTQACSNIERQNGDVTPSSRRANAHLKLCYLLLYIYVGRPFLFSDTPSRRPPATGGNPALHQQSIGITGISTLADECVQAATQIIDLLQSLYETIRLSRACYTEFSSCRAALLVLLAEWLRSGQRKRVSIALDRGMDLIQQMIGGNSNKSEVSLIEYLERAIKHISASLPSEDRLNNHHPADRELQSAYSSFKTWALTRRAENVPQSNPPPSSLGPHPISPSRSQYGLVDAADLFNTSWSFSDDDGSLDPFLLPLIPSHD
ncbi:hypothetical protein PV08_02227 [Exophiala spinifera]|uniref:Zn(2)-C6 fungal-type domain-containing protein n=1 Tax=Exophiala spinifera TaxID=91928 RepID=A0A0D2AA62_9EURO|nr:uncharacterized protein PV08_02227 [Exophiala spinifera]KIW21647.1 hypothetical protein PV08_02227 [Exophiala spinifera]